MSLRGVTVPVMDDLGSLADEISRFAAEHEMAVIPVIPGIESSPTVLLGPHNLGLAAFLGLAGRLGDGALYVRAEVVGTDPETGEPDDDLPGELARHKGQTCDVAVAFASGHGVIHVWLDTAPWWREWLDSQETVDTGDTGGQARQEERERAERELADVILADREYRASGPSARRRRGQLLIPAGTDHYTGFGAADLARRRAEELSEQAYRPVKEHLESLAAEFLASPGWREAASAAARKKAAESFLSSRADGWCPPSFIRDELYAQAQRLAKSGGPGLFPLPSK